MSEASKPATTEEGIRAALLAMRSGDVSGLVGILDADPHLAGLAIEEPGWYGASQVIAYFRNPRLLWFVANNPRLVDSMPAGLPGIANALVARGPARADLDKTLDLTMTSLSAREHGLQRPLMNVLMDAGARASRDAIASAGAHKETDALRALLDAGYDMTLPVAAALRDTGTMRRLIPHATADDLALAFGLAVINGCVEGAEIALDAGARLNAYLPVHRHSTALHQAADANDTAMIAMLLGRGALRDLRDTMFDGTPLGWAIHAGSDDARELLEAR